MTDQIIQKLNHMRQLIFQKIDVFETVKNKDIVLFVGNTRSGKSTVVNYIIGTPLKSSNVRKSVFNISKENPASPGPDIGVGSVSTTSVPSVWASQKFSSLVVDSPGFSDNRGEAQDVANSFHVKEILSNCNSAKLVIICDINDITSDNINQFILLMDNVNRLFSLGDRLSPAVTLVFTKEREGLTKQDITNILNDKIIFQPTIQIANRPLIEYLSRNPDHIALIKMPTQEGQVNDAQVFGNLIDIINSVSGKLGRDVLASVSPSVSDRSRNFLLEARHHFTEMGEFDQLMAATTNNFNATMTEFDNLGRFTASDQIPPMKAKLDGIEHNVVSIKNTPGNANYLLQRMSQVFPGVPELNPGSAIYAKMDFIAFVDGLLQISESNIFKVKIVQTVDQMINRINSYRSMLNDRQNALAAEENRIRLQKIKEEQDRQAELLRLELEKQKQLQEQIIRDPPRPNPVQRVFNNVSREATNVFQPVEHAIKKCSIM